jgi:hypothetical protein
VCVLELDMVCKGVIDTTMGIVLTTLHTMFVDSMIVGRHTHAEGPRRITHRVEDLMVDALRTGVVMTYVHWGACAVVC